MWKKKDIFVGRRNFEGIDAWQKSNFDLNGLKKVHFVPQHFFLEIDGELVMDFIGRYENLQVDFQYVCDTLHQENALPHLHKSDGKNGKGKR